jgi:catechol 2,3-dioxygenase-like lactoylglutathione lyase family enzyme
VITGIHTIIFSTDAEADRAFFRDVLGFESVDAGEGWLIFATPPAELAVHPAEDGGRHELYLMCDDLDATLAQLQRKGVEVTRSATEQSWGRVASIGLPGGGELSIYQPRHPIPLHPSLR